LGLRIKLIIICSLLFLAIGSTVFAAETTVQAYRSFVQQHELARAGDVRTIRSWMTIPYIAHAYHVPESYLYRTLHIVDPRPPRHTTLPTLASRYQRSVNDLIRTIQLAILAYRKQQLHPHSSTGQPTHAPPVPGRSMH
jgi:hypothetical protein